MATNTNPFYTYSATAGSSKTLQKPQDGGDNNQWGNYINTDLDEIVSAVNALSNKIADANENTLVDFTATTDAVNHVGITNSATGNPPKISSAGSDTNVDLTLTAQGTGDINLTPGTNGDVNIPSGKGVTFGDDGEKIEGDGTDLTIASSNDLNLTATTDINVPADVGVTFGNDGEKIEGDGTDLTIASSATLNINTGSSSGNDLKVNTSQLVVEGDTGYVGIGTSSPSEELEIQSATPAIKLSDTDESGSYGTVSMAQSAMYLQANGASSDGTLIYRTGNAGTFTERMRIDSSGNVLVGKTSTGTNTVGTEIKDDGVIVVTRDDDVCSVFNRKTSDGTIVEFRKDNSKVGSISTNGSRLQIGEDDAQLFFDDGSSKAIWPANASGGSDRTIDLGDPTARFDDAYIYNGVTTGSDGRDKQDIEELSEAEQRVAVACKGLLRKFRWKDMVAEKGDDARIHFGIIAQDLKSAFEAEGLDAGRYAMFIHSEWWETQTEVPAVEAQDAVYETQIDEEGNEVQVLVSEAVEAKEAYTRTEIYDTEAEAPEGSIKKDRMGVRYSELLAFIISAI